MSSNSQRPSPIEDTLSALGNILPPSVPETIRQNVLSSVKAALENLDFVTRQEIEVQETVLRRAREKIDALEARVRQLESERK